MASTLILKTGCARDEGGAHENLMTTGRELSHPATRCFWSLRIWKGTGRSLRQYLARRSIVRFTYQSHNLSKRALGRLSDTASAAC